MKRYVVVIGEEVSRMGPGVHLIFINWTYKYLKWQYYYVTNADSESILNGTINAN